MDTKEVTVIRSARKTLAIQIKPDGSLIVRAPMRMPEREICRFLEEKSDWIAKHLAKVAEDREKAARAPLSDTDIKALAARAKKDLPERTAKFAAAMGVTYGRITIRSQTTRWGSCSSKGNLNFNCLLMLAPEEVRDYVVVHELAHRRQMNHSAAFWREVAAVLPDYRQQVDWLKKNGGALIASMGAGTEAGEDL